MLNNETQRYQLVYNKETGVDESFQVDLKDRFVFKSPKGRFEYCPVTNYTIVKVEGMINGVTISKSKWDKWFEIDLNGIFNIL